MTAGKSLASGLAAYFWGIAALAVLLGVGVPAVQAQTPIAPAAGTGTAADPYQITVLGNLVWLSDSVTTAGTTGTYYKLKNDIDASATANWNDAGTDTSVLEGFKPIGSPTGEFCGDFDGQGHVISGLTINRPTTLDVGLFSYIGSGGTVENLGLEGGEVTGSHFAGGLAGCNDGGTVTSCYATGRVTAQVNYAGGLVAYNNFGTSTITKSYATGAVTLGNGFCAGGLAGMNGGTVTSWYATGAVVGSEQVGGLVGGGWSGTITDSYATGAVTVLGNGDCAGGLVGETFSSTVLSCYARGAVTGWADAGGLVGENGATITNSFATGAVTGGADVGGLVGENGATITNSYATGAVSAGGGGGGLVGACIGAPVVSACYWDTQTTGQSSSPGGGTGKTTAEMKQQATFVGWDFTNVWGIAENVTYPYLSGFQQPPFAPLNESPTDAADGVVLTPTLVASPFIDPNPADTHAASQWQVRTAASPSSWTQTVYDSGATAAALTSNTVPLGPLHSLTDYDWRVRYQDNHGNWSAWSEQTGFQTKYQRASAPTGVTASDGAFPDRVQVTWDPSPGDAACMVARSTRPTTATATAISAWMPGTSYDDLTAEPRVIYYYWVVGASFGLDGSMSTFSACDSGWAGTGPPFPSNYRGAILIIR